VISSSFYRAITSSRFFSLVYLEMLTILIHYNHLKLHTEVLGCPVPDGAECRSSRVAAGSPVPGTQTVIISYLLFVASGVRTKSVRLFR